MSQHNRVYGWIEAVCQHFAKLPRPQAKALALFSFGLALAQQCRARKAAGCLWWLGKPDSLRRRFERLLANDRLNLAGAQRCLSGWVIGALAAFAQTPGRLVLLVDETSLHEHLKVMVVALCFRRRALPLAWRCYRQDRYPGTQVGLVLDLLERVCASIPSESPILIEADRGIGTSSDLLKGIARRGWRYLVRVQSSVRLALSEGRCVRIADTLSGPGDRFTADVQAFKKAGYLPCRALGWYGIGHKEPWCLLTNDPDVVAEQYGLRMWQELAFRDLKSFGWQWQKSQVKDAQHADRLWLVMALAYAWTVSQGLSDDQKTDRQHGRYSIFQKGIDRLLDWMSGRASLAAILTIHPAPT